MGAYTRFYGQILVKPEFRAMIADLCDVEKTPLAWISLFHNVRPCASWLTEFAHFPRSNFIPRGSHEREPVYYISDDGIWTFDCELKNYEGGAIDQFMRLVVPNIAIKAELFSHYEEDAEAQELNYYSPEIAMSPELGNKEEVDLGLAPCLGGSKAV